MQAVVRCFKDVLRIPAPTIAARSYHRRPFNHRRPFQPNHKLFAYTHRDISNARSKFLRPTVYQKDKRLCFAQVPLSSYLSVQSSTTPDPGYQGESDLVRHHKREPRGRPFPGSLPQGTHKQTRRKALKHKTEKKIHKSSTALERSVKYFTGGFKPASWRQQHP